MNKKYLKAVIFLALAGAVLSSFLISQHYQSHLGLQGESFCSINQWIDCKRVNASPYSEVAGIPIAGFSLLFYLILLLYSVSAHFSRSEKKRGLFFCFFPVAIGFAITLRMAFISLFKIKVLCLFCSGLYLINLSLFLVFPRTLGISFKQLFTVIKEYFKATFGRPNSLGFAPKAGRHLLFMLTFFAAGFFIFVQIGKGIEQKRAELVAKNATLDEAPPLDEATLDQIIQMHFAQPVVAINPGMRPYWGKKGAKVVLVEFSDFECPFCKRAAEFIKPTLSEYKDNIVFYFVNYPLDQSCNTQMQHPLHLRSCAAAKAAICAGEQGQFWSYHDLTFADQKDLTEEALTDHASKLGLDLAAFKACRGAPETKQILQKDLALGKQVLVGGTPTLLINGRHLGPWSNPEILKAIVEEEINKN